MNSLLIELALRYEIWTQFGGTHPHLQLQIIGGIGRKDGKSQASLVYTVRIHLRKNQCVLVEVNRNWHFHGRFSLLMRGNLKRTLASEQAELILHVDDHFARPMHSGVQWQIK